MNEFDYLKYKREIIFKDEWKAYNLLKDLYTNPQVDKKMFWLAAGLTVAMLTYSYLDFWKNEKEYLKNLKENKLEKVVNEPN